MGAPSSDFDLALSRGEARELSLRRCAFRRCGSQPSGPNRLSRYLSDRRCDALNRNQSPEDCAGALAVPMHSATTRTAAALSQSETRLFARMCECTSTFPGKSSFLDSSALGTKTSSRTSAHHKSIARSYHQTCFSSCYRWYFFTLFAGKKIPPNVGKDRKTRLMANSCTLFGRSWTALRL